MAGDWIKMRMDLPDDPAVISISAAVELDEDAVVGKLHRLWSWADRHTIDGRTCGVTRAWVDRYVARQGFASAMESVGWLHFEGDTLVFPHFDKHNGMTAKVRAENTLRVRASRERRASVTERTNIPRPFVRYVLNRDKRTCVYCGAKEGEPCGTGSKIVVSVDHILPESRGGLTAIENLATSCLDCNMGKSDRTPDEAGLPIRYLQTGVKLVDGCLIVVTQESHISRDNGVTEPLPEREGEALVTVTKAPALDAAALSAIDWAAVVEECRSVTQSLKPQKQEDRALIVKSVVLSLIVFDRDWLWQAVKKAKRKTASSQFRYLHGALKGASRDRQADFNLLLSQVHVPDEILYGKEKANP